MQHFCGPPPPTPETSRAEAVRFLNQATFGATEANIDELLSLGSFEQWIDAQFDLAPSLTNPYVKSNSNGSLRSTRHHVWWSNALSGPDQLRQRLAFALSEIFVVSDSDYELGNAQYAISDYYDMLATNADGSFRTLLEKVTLHPVMGIYLSMLRNEKADPSRNVRPDENYAREILQLFTIGLYELSSDGTPSLTPTYDQALVEEFAKVFTGWNVANTEQWTSSDLTSYDKELPMVPVERYHDSSSKALLNGTVLPAGQSARQDLDHALDNIVAHPNVGPFVARSLIQRLVTSNPTSQYVQRIADAFDGGSSGERGDLRRVVKAILLDPEARTGHLTQPATFGKIKEPILRLTQLWRAFDATPGPTSGGVHKTYAKSMDSIDQILGQAPMRSPSVFNFFLPENPLHPESDLVAPELEILSEINVASTNNVLFQQVYENHSRTAQAPNVTVIDIEREVALAGDPEILVEHLDVLLTGASLPPLLRTKVIQQCQTHGSDDEGRVKRVLDAIFCIIASPHHLVQK